MIIFIIATCIGILAITYIEYRYVCDLKKFVLSSIDELPSSPKHSKAEIENIQLFKNALEFSSIKLRECIVPRTELVTIPIEDTLDNLSQKFISSGYSKILVYEDSIDNIIGYVHNSDMFKNPESIKQIIRNIQFVPETMNAKKLLLQLIHDKQSIAIVVDYL